MKLSTKGSQLSLIPSSAIFNPSIPCLTFLADRSCFMSYNSLPNVGDKWFFDPSFGNSFPGDFESIPRFRLPCIKFHLHVDDYFLLVLGCHGEGRHGIGYERSLQCRSKGQVNKLLKWSLYFNSSITLWNVEIISVQ